MIIRHTPLKSRALAVRTAHPHMTRRFASTQPSLHRDFYKTFTRPVAKVLLVAVAAYQFTYIAWMKLEQDEIKTERTTEIAQLERQVQAAQSKP